MSIKVVAWKCRECLATTESEKARALCQRDGHTLEKISAERTRWECDGCKFDVNVLDRNTPAHCQRYNGYSWTQVPLRRSKRAPMEREFLLARGEELKFLNSVAPQPGRAAFKYHREAEDDYA